MSDDFDLEILYQHGEIVITKDNITRFNQKLSNLYYFERNNYLGFDKHRAKLLFDSCI